MKKRFTQRLMIIVTAIGGIAIAGTATGALVIAGQAHTTAGRTSTVALPSGPGQKGVAAPGAERCVPTQVGFIGQVRAGQVAAAVQDLGSAVLAQVSDSAEGQLVIARAANGLSSAQISASFSEWSPLLSQSRNPALDSCDMMLADKPTAQPVISAAISSVAAGDVGTSSAALRSRLQEVLISDNPLRRGTVIVTLMVPGTAYQPANAPVLHHLTSYSAVVDISGPSPAVTGVGEGGV